MNIKASTKHQGVGGSKLKRLVNKRTNKRIRQEGKRMMEDAPPYRKREGWLT